LLAQAKKMPRPRFYLLTLLANPRAAAHTHPFATLPCLRRCHSPQPEARGASRNGTPRPFPRLPRTFHGALSGRENVAFVARIYGAGTRGVLHYVEEFSELGEYLHMPVNTYSAGMRARLAFATCLALDFDLYLIDEVTEVGDQRFRQKCAEAFRERMQRSDIILVTHNIHTLRQYCDRGAILANGELTLFDDIDTALGQYHRMVQESR
jgi:ABC-type polysaccharide/polyol phosphate transport system ATPase subunit